jgi:hypothetical protein
VDINTILQIVGDFTGHKWLPLAMLVISYLTATLGDTSKLPISIPDRWKPVLIVGLGQVYAVLQAETDGIPWQKAIWNGIVASFGAMGLFAIAFKAIYQGNVPKWLQWLAFIDPTLVKAKDTVGLTTKLFSVSRPSVPPAPLVPNIPPATPPKP